MPSCHRPEDRRLATFCVDIVRGMEERMEPEAVYTLGAAHPYPPGLLGSSVMPTPPLVEWAVGRYEGMYREGAEVDPLDVFDVGEGFVLANGKHRIEGLRRAGRETFEARVHVGDRPQAVGFHEGTS